MKFATESTALGITIDNKLNFRAKFEKCSREAEKAMGVLEPLVQNQFITPSTTLKLMNCVVIPVWTYLNLIWANPFAFTKSSLWYKILSKSSSTKYKHELTKMEYINVLSVNIKGLSKRSYEIVHQYMLTNSVQISCVTETNKQNTEVPDFPG